jgi:hypothetical protein
LQQIARLALGNQMWCRQADKLAWRDDLVVLPERRKVPGIAGDKEIGASRIDALNKDVVVRVARHLDPVRGANEMAVILDELKQLNPQPFPN